MVDAIIVLGGGLTPKGELNDASRSRVEELGRIYKRYLKNKRLKIIFSGKYGFLSSKEFKTSEAALMKKKALELGIEKKRILIETKSQDTIANAYYTKKQFLEPRKLKNIIVITSDFHIPRTAYIFEKTLGKGYRVRYIPVKSKMNSLKRHERLVKEQTILQYYRVVLHNGKSGDDVLIKSFINSGHPWTQMRRILK